ncbi:MAG: transcription-repair coupling factor [Acidobacteria bacterium]|jgi:transcription-repair coupling factor (superfamily II helicase)|nr:MAG: transcription-repair coupling factor [Acidobacteriota bacterium]GIU81419.1 MAG: transcription-repair-coupling factor [Pyrinomonadaceae bacterium]
MNPAQIEIPDSLKTLSRRLASLLKANSSISLKGLISTSAKAFFLSQLQQELNAPLVVIIASNDELETWQSDLEFFIKKQNRFVLAFPSQKENSKPLTETKPSTLSQIISIPAFETSVYSGTSPHLETQEERAVALWRLATKAQEKPSFILISAKALLMRIASPSEIKNYSLSLKVGEDVELEKFIKKLISSGYVREEPIYGQGQFSLRGGIVDVWSPHEDLPFRIEFFGDMVDSIRRFDPNTQLSVEKIESASIAPMREFFFDAEKLKEWGRIVREKFSADSEAFARFKRSIEDYTAFTDEGEAFPGIEFLLPIAFPLKSTIFDYLPSDCVLTIDEPSMIEQNLITEKEKHISQFQEAFQADCICPKPEEIFLSEEEFREKIRQFKRIEMRLLGIEAALTDEPFRIADLTNKSAFLFQDFANEVEIISRSTRKFNGNLREFINELKAFDSKRVIVANSEGIAGRIIEILRDYEINAHLAESCDFDRPISIVVGKLSSGFEFPSLKLIFQTEEEIFGESKALTLRPDERAQSKRRSISAFISDFRDLKPGDYVVHVDYGIGRFEQLKKVVLDGIEREFLVLVYADNAKLLVPVERLDLVSRYGSAEGKQPSLDKLGSINWQKTKLRAKKAMREMADELLRLYAERKLVKGFAFSKDTVWQKEFEEAFPYELTPDQAIAIEAVKKDMEQDSPMDRLIVGDVGYGKTEVAMRAAFKAVMDNKQVVVLAPTTVLAYQHFETFKSRFAAFPVNIELLSRFRSKAEQKQILKSLEEGKIDILIGTHRIFSNDVRIPRLGLLIVDEEQRFGVAHKEKLKKMKKAIDVLTLSATPIPRTLNMALMGLRDISIIETPPRDRLAINTQIVQFSEKIIKNAIEQELARSGQVFFIHNRVETIEYIASKLKQIVPQARICIAHGQMNEKEVEKTMLDFIDYKYDVLVATTIIENGIDIPRANTIIINRADTYGLAQLYQLRGRVGRSNRRAYAYLLIPSEAELSPIARRRLAAIREFSDLGAGFRLAALDLELRGAGNLLGAEQSGHVEALGFELYVKMLERTIRELQGEIIEDEESISINLGIPVFIPNEYISETSQRLKVYKQIASAKSNEELEQIRESLSDRYGKIPDSVNNLLAYSRLKILAERLRVISIDKTQNKVAIKFSDKTTASPDKLIELLKNNKQIRFSPNGILYVTLEDDDPIRKIEEILKQIADF